MVTALLASALLTGCERPRVDPASLIDTDSAARGKAAAVRLGCAACHIIPGIDWPRGEVGPALTAFADRPLIAGRLPNRPVELAAFVRNAPAYLPGTAMPPIAMSDADAADIAAYLLTLDDPR